MIWYVEENKTKVSTVIPFHGILLSGMLRKTLESMKEMHKTTTRRRSDVMTEQRGNELTWRRGNGATRQRIDVATRQRTGSNLLNENLSKS